MIVGEHSPTVLHPGPIAAACCESFANGVDVENTGSAYTSECGCGYPMAARTVAALQAAFRAHVAYRRRQ